MLTYIIKKWIVLDGPVGSAVISATQEVETGRISVQG
jgi:hypothetical protein